MKPKQSIVVYDIWHMMNPTVKNYEQDPRVRACQDEKKPSAKFTPSHLIHFLKPEKRINILAFSSSGCPTLQSARSARSALFHGHRCRPNWSKWIMEKWRDNGAELL